MDQRPETGPKERQNYPKIARFDLDPGLKSNFVARARPLLERGAPVACWLRSSRRFDTLSGLTRRDLLALVACALAVGASASTTLAEEVRLAIKGYDPVSYFEQGKATPGLVAYELVWDEQRYRFSRPEHRDLFKANPTRYLPQFTNYCTMALARGLLKEANPEYWLINEGRLFLFSMAEGPSRFRSSPAENVDKAEANRVLLPATVR